MTPETLNKRELVINQFDAVSELLFEIYPKGKCSMSYFRSQTTNTESTVNTHCVAEIT